MKEILGSNAVNCPGMERGLLPRTNLFGGAAKQKRAYGVLNSDLMKDTYYGYKDNDVTYDKVSMKHHNPLIYNYRKTQHHPKAQVQWVQPKR